MEFAINFETPLQLFISFIIGAIIGAEREYRSKVAGLRTMIMTCLGSTIFTEVSVVLGETSPDRIASNIITGVGFLGAGVIFKDGLTITGITTATTIWITAALGMATGAGEYFLAGAGTCTVVIVLSFFEKIQRIIARMHQERVYKVTFARDADARHILEGELKKCALKSGVEKDMKNEDESIVVYQVVGQAQQLEKFNEFLKTDPRVRSFEY